MTPFLQDVDLTVYVGDVLDVLPTLPAASVDCVITSPPYWGLRDYGTAEWVGGDDECDHLQAVGGAGKSTLNTGTAESQRSSQETQRTPYKRACGKCGAERMDSQLGLEATPELYVESMVKVFREVRRVLADHGTVWLNLGDSYVSTAGTLRTISAGGKNYDALNDEGGDGTLLNEERQKFGKALRQVPDGKNPNAMIPTEGPNRFPVQGLKSKDMVGIPWRVAFALQADGWYLRSDIIWAKPNPMPESITDRPTKSHEYVFLLSKLPRYFFDQEAVREPFAPASEDRYRYAFGGAKNEALVEANKNGIGRRTSVVGLRDFPGGAESAQEALIPVLPAVATPSPGWEERKAAGATRGNVAFDGNVGAGTQRAVHGEGLSHDLGSPSAGRNMRSVWEITTQAFPEAHFATYPQELVRRCLLAGCPQQVCGTCGKPRERIVEKRATGRVRDREGGGIGRQFREANEMVPIVGQFQEGVVYETAGWSDCGHGDWRVGVILDPFAGSGTTGLVARNHQRHAVLVELNEEYGEMISVRLQQLSLLGGEA